MKTVKKIRAPVRIDLAGGTTDIYPFTHSHGGAVLNCAINRYVEGKIIKTDKYVHLEYTGNAPTSSGLGTSGVMNLVWLSLISQVKLKNKKGFDFENKMQLAETVYKLEQAMNLVGGKQDQYAAAFGGINFIEFKKDKVKLTKLNLSEKFIKEFEDKLILVYTGEPHFSGVSNKSMIGNLKKGKNTRNLVRIKKIAVQMKNALLKKDLERFAELMNEETQERRLLHESIVPKHIDSIIAEGFKHGAISAKICGSGGGGSILFFGDKEKLRKFFRNKVIDFEIDFEGLKFSD